MLRASELQLPNCVELAELHEAPVAADDFAWVDCGIDYASSTDTGTDPCLGDGLGVILQLQRQETD